MRRSRSSFDLTGAVEKAAALSPSPPTSTSQQKPALYEGVALVSFTQAEPEFAPTPMPATPPVETPPVETPPVATELAETATAFEGTRALPEAPDLSALPTTGARCERVLEWVARGAEASDVFIADAHGLPVAGGSRDGERKMAAAGGLMAAVRRLAATAPGNVTRTFATHLGEGPVLCVLSFESGGSSYLLGMILPAPLAREDVEAVRQACREALLPIESPS
jgi:hypothetical protein